MGRFSLDQWRTDRNKNMLLPSIALTLTVCTLLISSELIQCTVFLDQSTASQILRLPSSSRRRRANSFSLEEMLPGNLERECYEESCSQEEAAEIFQTKEKTLEFWYRYTNLNPCLINPCMNGGICTMDRGHFTCLCPPQYNGKICESVVLECHYRNGGCLQYCRDLTGGGGVQCGCAEGFKLDPDGQSCSSTVLFPCGRQQMHILYRGRSLWDVSEWDNITMETHGNITENWDLKLNFTETEEERMTMNSTSRQERRNDTWLMGDEREGGEAGGEEEENDRVTTRIVGGVLEKPGGSPWQVLIHRSDGYGFCGGTLVSDRWVVSAAHCFEESADHVTIGNYDKRRPDQGEQLIKIQRVFVHPHFHSFTFDSDIALVYLAQPVLRGPTAVPACLPDAHLSKYLLKEDNRGVVTGWGLTRFMGRSSRFLRKVALPVVSYKDCTASTEQVITDNMFCAGYLETSMDACSGDSGGPFMVSYRGTWFLTGIISWGEKCAAKGKYGVYTRLGNFLNWIRDTMERQDLNGTRS
ncbi:coagulation factor VII-like [Seriola lalandi dorsalis]|uniref:coagulation factor VII-like n=1 Tax=Seriola lalandi dorsalis TaxID=1841481 RepID=UPI000C6F793F|nr:coagulation factor VII-like [Seriola lalandi dorsalis]XP_023252027.1 coagulation factor VII-like [Seriola lalandi dorsalis]